MSGHSKWSTIHRQKEVNDAKRGATFTKLALAVTVAAKQGRGLQMAIDRAREANMPKENIQRAIDKGLGGGQGINLEEAVFEAFLPGGVVAMIQTLTENKLRTGQEIRQIIEKNGGTLGSVGAVSYMFDANGKPHDWAVVPVADPAMRQQIEAILEKLNSLDNVQEIKVNYA